MEQQNNDVLKDRVEALKAKYNGFKNENFDKANEQYTKFLNSFPKTKLKELTLKDYTNLKEPDKTGEYFTYWLERGTETCGKFRTASSYAYGIYKVNPDNKPKDLDDSKWKEAAENGYRTTDIRNEKKNKFISGDDANDWFEKEVRPILIKLSEFINEEGVKPLEINFARKIAYLYNPDKLIPIFKKEVIQEIANFFGVNINGCENSYKVTALILKQIKTQFHLDITEKNGFEVTQKLAAFLWAYFGKQVDFDKNTIFYGPPGTGKTYSVIESVKQKLVIDSGEFEMVQFHPSFGYEDFIDGLKPSLNKEGQVQLSLKNGLFKAFCIKATKALIEARKEKKEPQKYYFIVDEINRAELSAVFGEVLSCLEEDKRLDFELDDSEQLVKKKSSLVISTQNSYLIDSEENAVYTEEGSSGNKRYLFGVPSNIVFIGTMNDIDRSVDTFDFALRRRFTWVHKGFDKDALSNCDQLKGLGMDATHSYVESCSKLNDFVANKLNLGRSYEIGHAYFMKASVNGSEVSKSAKGKLFDQHLASLLEEYLRSEYPTKEIEGKVKEARNIFVGNE